MFKRQITDLKSYTISDIRAITVANDVEIGGNFLEAMKRDSRVGVRKIYEQILRQKLKHDNNLSFVKELFKTEEKLKSSGYRVIVGVDEAGRGPLAGPVVAAAVVLPGYVELPGLNDSKKLTASARNKTSMQIKKVAMDWSIGISTVNEILCYNIHRASMLAMKRAISSLKLTPDYILLDGRCVVDGIETPQQPVVGGDGTCACIAAASVIAKVARDELMKIIHSLYPQYGFNRHKGYPTREHICALRLYGVTPVHRIGFKPVKNMLCNDTSLNGR